MNLRENWWPVAFVADIKPGTVQSLTILNDPICVFKNQDNDIGVLADRCLHRGEPLSLGRVEKSNLQSHYHGWEYNVSGQVVHIPSISDEECKTMSLKVYSYPIRLHCDRLWVWTGEHSAAATALLPEIPCFKEPASKWRFLFSNTFDLEGVCPVLAMENQTDIAHGPFVHHGTLANRSMAQILSPMYRIADLGSYFGSKFQGQSVYSANYVLKSGKSIEQVQTFPFTQCLINGNKGNSDILSVIQIVPMGREKTRYM